MTPALSNPLLQNIDIALTRWRLWRSRCGCRRTHNACNIADVESDSSWTLSSASRLASRLANCCFAQTSPPTPPTAFDSVVVRMSIRSSGTLSSVCVSFHHSKQPRPVVPMERKECASSQTSTKLYRAFSRYRLLRSGRSPSRLAERQYQPIGRDGLKTYL